MAQTRILLLISFFALIAGCGPKTEVHSVDWPGGGPRARESYYYRDDHRVMHGVTTYWDKSGVIIAEGTWKGGKPFDGLCYVYVAGDAGNAGGIGQFERYRNGALVEKVAGSPWSQ